VVASSDQASAVVYCQYISYPAGCIVRPGVRLVARPVARAVVTPGVGAPGVGVRAGTESRRPGQSGRPALRSAFAGVAASKRSHAALHYNRFST